MRRKVAPPPIQNRTGVTWAETGFDDASWTRVDLPHDFVLLGDYTEEADAHHGYLPRNLSGWYRKKFSLPARYGSASGYTWLHFEGAFQAVDIWVNGVHVKRHTSGYLGFDVDLSSASTSGSPLLPGLKYGDDGQNVIVVRADASFGSGHWYEGGGIQRKVWLNRVEGRARFVTDGLFAQTASSSVTAHRAVVVPTAEVEGGGGGASVEVRYALVDPTSAAVVATSSATIVTTDAATATTVSLVSGGNLTVDNPRLWSIKTPTLYTLVAELLDEGGTVIDTLNTSIGLRSIDWSSSEGFSLNGEGVHIRGFSHHSDFGGVGGAVPDRINVFRANALRSVGGNTWRTSHNPYRPAVYDILDAVGVLVWDENRDFNQLNTMDMERLVRRDRNHASVVMWSACNEIECWVSGDANATGAQMRAATKKWDTTRPFTANLNQVNELSPRFNDTLNYLSPQLDVLGFSHKSVATDGAASMHAALPSKPVISSECCSCRTQVWCSCVLNILFNLLPCLTCFTCFTCFT
jgi:beta-galactosidase/beta-glucuronidase